MTGLLSWRGRAGRRGAPRLCRGVPTVGGSGAMSGPPCHWPARTRGTEARHGFTGACRTCGGLGAISGPPISMSARIGVWSAVTVGPGEQVGQRARVQHVRGAEPGAAGDAEAQLDVVELPELVGVGAHGDVLAQRGGWS